LARPQDKDNEKTKQNNEPVNGELTEKALKLTGDEELEGKGGKQKIT